MSTADVSANDTFESLTGFDEIAIAKAFGDEIERLRKRPFMFLRALIFVTRRRAGLKDAAAYSEAMGLTMADLGDYFPDDPPEFDPEDPDTESGKDDTPSS